MKRILCVLSEFGYWGEELVGPYKTGELLVEVLENGLRRYGW